MHLCCYFVMGGSGFLGKLGNGLRGAGACKPAFMSHPEFCPKKEY